MFRLSISEEDDVAQFSCEFCSTEYEWPFSAHITKVGEGSHEYFPSARHVIMSHHFGDSNLTKFGFPQCPKWGMWKNTSWEVTDRDNENRRLDAGTVMVRDGYPTVTGDR